MISRRALLLAAPAMAAIRPASARITRTAIWRYRDTGKTWYHPRAGLLPGSRLFMALQQISGSDVFHPVHWSESTDLGATWSTPQPIPGMGRKTGANGLDEGICDIVPEYHQPTGTMLAVGHNVFYDATGKLAKVSSGIWTYYAVRDAAGAWGPLRRLELDHPEATAMHSAGCSQRITLPGGDVLIPLSIATARPDRAVCSVRCRFDGRELRVSAVGNVLHNTAGRGLLEPSLARFGSRFYMTIRAEDNRGYVTASVDGLQWQPARPWAWDDGEPLTLSTTQQHWISLPHGLFLVYCRKDAANAQVMRWRTPVYMAQVDPGRLCLLRATEQVVFPLRGDAVNHPKDVAIHGNFHTTVLSPREALVTSCDLVVKDFSGDTLQARIRWP